MFILGAFIFGTVGVLATTSIQANQIGYTKNGIDITLDTALDDLYNQANKAPTQVATLTTRGETYTMQNDGYIVGSASASNSKNAIIYINNTNSNYILAPYNTSDVYPVSLYIQKNTTITTRSDGGIYDLTIYEWK